MVIKDKITKIIIHLAGLAALFLFVVLRMSGEPEYLLDKKLLTASNNFDYGDLYFLNLIDNFKVPTPPLGDEYYNSVPKSDISEADILTFGDSFFAAGARVKNVPGRLADTLKKKIYFSQSSEPLELLSSVNLQKGNKKYLILETAERRIPNLFSGNQNKFTKKNHAITNIITTVLPVNSEQRYTFLLQRSFLTHFIYKELATLKFNYFGYITSVTPVYKKDPPWLFYYQDVNDKKTSFYYKFSDEEIKNICDNIQDISNQLKEKYNIDFIFLPVPNKYTIYHKILNNDEYNNLLPRIYYELKKRNVKFCNVYDLFMKSDKELYYPTDTHWNEEGVKLTTSELVKLIESEK
jgi:hypothetical protein